MWLSIVCISIVRRIKKKCPNVIILWFYLEKNVICEFLKLISIISRDNYLVNHKQ